MLPKAVWINTCCVQLFLDSRLNLAAAFGELLQHLFWHAGNLEDLAFFLDRQAQQPELPRQARVGQAGRGALPAHELKRLQRASCAVRALADIKSDAVGVQVRIIFPAAAVAEQRADQGRRRLLHPALALARISVLA